MLGPVARDMVIEQGLKHEIQLKAHQNLPIDRFFERDQALADDLEQRIEPQDFLEEEDR